MKTLLTNLIIGKEYITEMKPILKKQGMRGVISFPENISGELGKALYLATFSNKKIVVYSNTEHNLHVVWVPKYKTFVVGPKSFDLKDTFVSKGIENRFPFEVNNSPAICCESLTKFIRDFCEGFPETRHLYIDQSN